MPQTRGFDPASIQGLSNDAREAINAVFEAMTAWQGESAKLYEKNSKKVFDKMAAAVTALGWPEQIVDAARAQMLSVSEMQGKTIEQIREVWEEQLKLPNPAMASPEAILSKFKTMPSLEPPASWPNAEALRGAAAAPLALWMEFGKQWQQLWLEALERVNKANRG